MKARRNPKRGFDKILRPNYNENHSPNGLDDVLGLWDDDDDLSTRNDGGASSNIDSSEDEFGAAFSQVSVSPGHENDEQRPENLEREFISDKDSSAIWNIPVDFSPNTSSQYSDFVYCYIGRFSLSRGVYAGIWNIYIPFFSLCTAP
jgi:hypothetical protein